MADTESRHKIKYILELDEADVKKTAKRVEDAFNKTGSPSAASPASAPAAQAAKATEESKKQADTIGDSFAKHLTERMQRLFGASKDVAGTAAQDMVQLVAGSSRVGGRLMGAPAGMLASLRSGGVAGALAAAGPAAVVGATVAALYGLYKATQYTAKSVVGFGAALANVNPSMAITAFADSLKAVGLWTTLAFGPAGLIPLTLGAGLSALSSIMGHIIGTFGEYNATVIGQMRVTELMSRMLKIQVGQYLQPAMEAWVKLLQDIMSIMSDSGDLWKNINNVLTFVIKGLDAFVRGLRYDIELFAYGARIMSDAIRLIQAAALMDPIGGALAIKDLKNDIAADAHPRGANLQAQALAFNRAFIDALVGPGGAGGAAGAGGAPGNQPRHVGGGGAGAVPQRAPMVNMPAFETKITLNIEQQLMHETSVKQAVENIKASLLNGLKTVRDETNLLNSVIDGHSVGYGL